MTTSSSPFALGRIMSIGVLITNLLVIVLAVFQDWDLRPLIIIYWTQSVMIGFFNFLRMILLRSFDTNNFTSNGRQVEETARGKWSTAIFFAFHYGIFHVVYLVFILTMVGGGLGESAYDTSWDPSPEDGKWMGFAILGFLVSHSLEFVQNVIRDRNGKPSLGTMMFLPYARIIPMHLTILLGFSFGSNRIALLFFLALKTGADFLMEFVEARFLNKSGSTE